MTQLGDFIVSKSQEKFIVSIIRVTILATTLCFGMYSYHLKQEQGNVTDGIDTLKHKNEQPLHQKFFHSSSLLKMPGTF
jgi:hypothetical protein